MANKAVLCVGTAVVGASASCLPQPQNFSLPLTNLNGIQLLDYLAYVDRFPKKDEKMRTSELQVLTSPSLRHLYSFLQNYSGVSIV